MMGILIPGLGHFLMGEMRHFKIIFWPSIIGMLGVGFIVKMQRVLSLQWIVITALFFCLSVWVYSVLDLLDVLFFSKKNQK